MASRFVPFLCALGLLFPSVVFATTGQFELNIYGFECFDGVDNDADGFIDFPNDPDCLAQNDDSEASPVPVSNEANTPSETTGGGGHIPEQVQTLIEIEPLPNTPGNPIHIVPVLLPPDVTGVPFNPQPEPGLNKDTVLQYDGLRTQILDTPQQQSSVAVVRSYLQPLLPALEIHMRPRFSTTSSRGDIGTDEFLDDIPIHSPHSPLAPIFVTFGVIVSGLSISRIGFVFV